MSTISAGDVKKLRDMTNAPMMNCKAALEKAGGDLQKAVQVLRESNAAIQAKVGARETAEGRIAIHIDPAKAVASILEMRCESAPVAKGPNFVQLASDVAKHVAVAPTPAGSVDDLLSQKFVGDPQHTVKERITGAVGLIRENMRVARFARLTGGQFGSYVHHDGTIGVLLQVDGAGKADPELLKGICMHITVKQPAAINRDQVDAKLLETEKEIARKQAAGTGKPANIVEKIVEGKMKTWYGENVLVEQPFIKDDTKTIGQLLQPAGLTIKQFVRYQVGQIVT